MNDLVLLIPDAPIIRSVAFFVGMAVLVHMYCMAGFLPEDSPFALVLQISLGAFAGAGLIVGALVGAALVMLLFSLLATISQIGLMLWLWRAGMHVSEFMERKLR